MVPKNGLIVITGVDGAGKSSVIEALRGKFAYDAKLILVPRRSKPKQQGQGDKIDNHALPNRLTAASIAKLIFRSVTWFLKYKIKYEPLLKQGYVIIFDRFYLDELILDPKKHRYTAPLWMTKFALKSLPYPDVYILLDAPERVLFSRKQESSFQEVQKLRSAHLHWALQQPEHYIVDASMPLENVVSEVHQIINERVQK